MIRVSYHVRLGKPKYLAYPVKLSSYSKNRERGLIDDSSHIIRANVCVGIL